jgi:hypothetical protein
VSWQLPVSPQVMLQLPPGQLYSQLPITLHEQLVPAAQVPVKLPRVVLLLPQLEAATPIPARHASSSPTGFPNLMKPSCVEPFVEFSIDMSDFESGKGRPEERASCLSRLHAAFRWRARERSRSFWSPLRPGGAAGRS